MYGCRSPGLEPAAIKKPYMLVANFSRSLMSVQCRAGCVRLGERVTAEGLPSCIGVARETGTTAEVSSAYEPPADRAEESARDLEQGGRAHQRAFQPTFRRSRMRPSRSERPTNRAPRIAAAEERRKQPAEQEIWNDVRMPAECFRFAPDAAQAARDRATPEYAQKVLEAVGLTIGPGERRVQPPLCLRASGPTGCHCPQSCRLVGQGHGALRH